MAATSETDENARRMRDKAQELEQAAAHATEPTEHDRLMRKALRIREASERVNGPGSGTMDPM
ncbi:DUF6381 family protein [Streptomyces sp. NPDC058701]|uniref:DUF6381 family protein n=1 Tax=Streptomyces sp. NPDC058701 TaxID=3346608 RepID=UPI0036558FC4